MPTMVLASSIAIELWSPATLHSSRAHHRLDVWRRRPIRDGPLSLQRQQLLDSRASRSDARLEDGTAECRFFVAVQPTDSVIDLLSGLCSAPVQRGQPHFELDQSTSPGRGQYRWAPYMASVAVCEADRRSGLEPRSSGPLRHGQKSCRENDARGV